MRISTQQLYTQGLAGITNASSQVAQTQEQIASGRRVSKPSDDPIAAARIIQLESQLNLDEQYLRNIQNVEGRLEINETQLVAIEDVLLRIRELVIQAGNGALSNQDRELITTEINQRVAELEGLANTRDAEGNYIFSGFSTGTPPFVRQGDGYVYQGDEGVRFESIANGLSVASNETGSDLFLNIPIDRADVLVTSLDSNTSGVQVARARVVDQSVFDAAAPQDYVLRFNPLSDVVPAGANYTITDRFSGNVVVANQPYSAGDIIAINGAEIQFDALPDSGDSFLFASTQQRDMLTTVERIGQGLAAFTDSNDRDAFVGQALNNLDNIQQVLLQGRSRIGARLNTIDSARVTLEAQTVSNQSVLSEIRDLDYNEAVSRLSFQSFVLEAAQSSFTRIANLSLFNFLR